MPTQFIHIPPTQRICNRNPSSLAADSIYCVTRTLRHPVAQPAQIERCNKRMADSLSIGHRSPRRYWSASCSSHCSLGTRWKEGWTGCPAFLSKFIVTGGYDMPILFAITSSALGCFAEGAGHGAAEGTASRIKRAPGSAELPGAFCSLNLSTFIQERSKHHHFLPYRP